MTKLRSGPLVLNPDYWFVWDGTEGAADAAKQLGVYVDESDDALILRQGWVVPRGWLVLVDIVTEYDDDTETSYTTTETSVLPPEWMSPDPIVWDGTVAVYEQIREALAPHGWELHAKWVRNAGRYGTGKLTLPQRKATPLFVGERVVVLPTGPIVLPS